MISSLRHIALLVPDLRVAEAYYLRVFDMEIIGREAMLKDGLWYTLPFDKGWDDAVAGGRCKDHRRGTRSPLFY